MRIAIGLAIVGALGGGLAGCLRSPGGNHHASECKVDADCNTDAGEVCDEGVCWGDPPDGNYAAVLAPPSSAAMDSAATELPELAFDPDGWFADVHTGDLSLVPTVHVSGGIKGPCPSGLANCSSYLAVAATVRWSRDSILPGADRVSVPVTAGSDGFDVWLPKPAVATTYTVAIVPSTDPIGPGLPAPAQFFAPQKFTVVINPSDAEVGVTRSFQLGAASSHTLTGRISRGGGAVLSGWRVHAEAGDGETLGALVRASNIAVTGANGDFALTVPDGPTVVDVVVEPPAPANRNDPTPPSVRVRDHVIGASLPTIDIPAIDAVAAVPFGVRGMSGGGTAIDVIGAKVVATLDQELPTGGFLEYQAAGTTAAGGVASLPMFLGTDTLSLTYTIDVLPGPDAEQASTYGLPLQVGTEAPYPAPVMLSRRVALVGTLLDADGYPLTDTAVSASVAGIALCSLSSAELRAARSLAPAQATTDGKGEFKLWLDPDLAGTELTYDLAVEPSIGTWAPRWTFTDQALPGDASGGLTLWMPEAAHVRAHVFDPGHQPIADTAVSLYQLTGKPPPCAQAIGPTYAGGVELRAIGQSDDLGVVRVILPRL